MTGKALSACVLALALGACTHAKTGDTIEAAFACNGGARLSVTFDNKTGVAVVRTQAGGMHVLTRTISGSGYSYEAEGRKLRGKGREAIWTDTGAAPLTCQERGN
ncbi:MAG: MliC family protein [Rhodospirillaceae bacterium]|nr:MliC family protein [Rhodospirillaceae bacterium]